MCICSAQTPGYRTAVCVLFVPVGVCVGVSVWERVRVLCLCLWVPLFLCVCDSVCLWVCVWMYVCGCECVCEFVCLRVRVCVPVLVRLIECVCMCVWVLYVNLEEGMESIAILLLFTTQYYMKPIKLFLADKTAKIPSWCRKFCPPKFCPILGGGRKLEGPKKSCFFLGGRKFKGPNWEKVPEN